jgi:hypothetical protein
MVILAKMLAADGVCGRQKAMSERDIIKIAITPQAKRAIEAVCERYGMSQIELASRLYTWLADQDEVLQAAVLGILPDSVAPDVAEMVLQRMADSGGRKLKAAKPAKKAIHITTELPGGKPRRGPGRKA